MGARAAATRMPGEGGALSAKGMPHYRQGGGEATSMPSLKSGRYAKWVAIAHKARYALLVGLAGAALLGAALLGAACGDDGEACACDPVAGAAGSGGTAGAPMGGGGAGGSAGGGGGGGGGTGGGGGLVCTAPQKACGEACVEVASDGANCGECGYACGQGSACEAGACQPVPVVSGVVAPYAFVLDAESLYFVVPVRDAANALPPAVQRVPRAGGAPVSVFGTVASVRSRSLALADGTLYFGDLDNNGVIRKGATSGGDVTTHLADQPAVQQLVAADGRLWWSTFDGTSRLRRASAAGTPAVAEELLPGPSFVQFGRVPAVAVEGASAEATAWWVNAGGSVATDAGLWRKAEGAAAERLAEAPGLRALSLGPDGAYVTDGATVARAAKAAPGPLTEVVGASAAGGAVQGLAVANERLYWLVFEAGQLALHRAGLDGSGARVLGRVEAKSGAYWAQPIGPAQLVVDGGQVYFSDPGSVTGNLSASNPGLEGVTGAADGAIYRVAQ
jgi:hypothetical protein